MNNILNNLENAYLKLKYSCELNVDLNTEQKFLQSYRDPAILFMYLMRYWKECFSILSSYLVAIIKNCVESNYSASITGLNITLFRNIILLLHCKRIISYIL